MSDTIHFSTRDWETDVPQLNTIEEAKVVLKDIGDLLEEKNKAYGDSALSPIRIFSQLKASNTLAVRIDDKLSRIKSVGITEDTEDSVRDLIGYLTLLLVAIEREGK